MGIFGLVVNPKDGELFAANLTGSMTVEIRSLDDGFSGKGYFDDGDSSYSQSTEVTGLPRVHTPSGVADRGRGLGTVLYTALCLAAHLDNDGELRIRGIPRSGDGISSNDNRSTSASRWWEAARVKYGLAERVEGCSEEERVEDSFDAGRRNNDSRIVEAIEEHGGYENFKLESYSVSYEGTREECGLEADAYPYENAIRANLIVATIKHASGVTEFANVDPSDVVIENERAFAAANTGVLKSYGNEGLLAMQKLLEIARESDISQADRGRMLLRFTRGMDENSTDWAYAEPKGARANPRRPRKGVSATRMGRVDGRRVPLRHQWLAPLPARGKSTPAKRLYGRVRANPAPTDAEAKAVLTALRKQRAALGWGVFAADKNSP